MYAHLYASSAKEECGQVTGSSADRARRLEELGAKYTYGWFEGKDKLRHVGVYREAEELMAKG